MKIKIATKKPNYKITVSSDELEIITALCSGCSVLEARKILTAHGSLLRTEPLSKYQDDICSKAYGSLGWKNPWLDDGPDDKEIK